MKTRYLFAFAIICFILGLVFLDQNARTVASKRAAILAADAIGTDVSAEVLALRAYSGSHINANAALFLVGAYSKAVDEAKANAQPQADGKVYAQAQAACTQKNAMQQAQCIAGYVASNTPKMATTPVNLPEQSAYIYDFRSPGWAPDLAGLSLLAGFCSLILGLWLFTFKYGSAAR